MPADLDARFIEHDLQIVVRASFAWTHLILKHLGRSLVTRSDNEGRRPGSLKVRRKEPATKPDRVVSDQIPTVPATAGALSGQGGTTSHLVRFEVGSQIQPSSSQKCAPWRRGGWGGSNLI